jgi:hypothetical protein
MTLPGDHLCIGDVPQAARSTACQQSHTDEDDRDTGQRTDAQNFAIEEDPGTGDPHDRKAGRDSIGGAQRKTPQRIEIAAEEHEAEEASNQEGWLQNVSPNRQPGTFKAAVLDKVLERNIGANVRRNCKKQEYPAAQSVIPSLRDTGSDCPALNRLPSPDWRAAIPQDLWPGSSRLRCLPIASRPFRVMVSRMAMA